MAIGDRNGLPIAVCVTSATPHEVTLVETTLNQLVIDEAPPRLIGDKAYDSDGLDKRLLEERGIQLIAPNIPRAVRKKPPQDGRPLRRYRRRWKIERLFAWFHNFRKLVTRYERHPENFLAFVQLACVLILLRRF